MIKPMIYSGDQQKTTPTVINGAHANVAVMTLKAAAPANTVYTFSADWWTISNGVPFHFRSGQSYQLDATQKAALLAASAPMAAA
jgi:hypothetical protein